jgi:hypothetical protein
MALAGYQSLQSTLAGYRIFCRSTLRARGPPLDMVKRSMRSFRSTIHQIEEMTGNLGRIHLFAKRETLTTFQSFANKSQHRARCASQRGNGRDASV